LSAAGLECVAGKLGDAERLDVTSRYATLPSDSRFRRVLELGADLGGACKRSRRRRPDPRTASSSFLARALLVAGEVPPHI
jgi:hypothetical protein